jgi:hypothetical protein
MHFMELKELRSKLRKYSNEVPWKFVTDKRILGDAIKVLSVDIERQEEEFKDKYRGQHGFGGTPDV